MDKKEPSFGTVSARMEKRKEPPIDDGMPFGTVVSYGTVKKKEPSIGIDVGMSYSRTAVWLRETKNSEIIPNVLGNPYTPCYVGFTDTEMLIGEPAKNQSAANPLNTIYDIKRLIGRNYNDVRIELMQYPFKVIAAADDKPMILVSYMGQEKQMSAGDISTLILSNLGESAKEYLGCFVKNAVLSVPAYFNEDQRNATRDAATNAGFAVIEIVDEPVAACMAYGLGLRYVSTEKKVCVFDFGSTLDITLLIIKDGDYEVKARGGDPHLGGEDFDNRILNFFVNEFKQNSNLDIRTISKSLRRLKLECVKAKTNLSFDIATEVVVDALFEGVDFKSSITRAKFEEICSEVFDKCFETLEFFFDSLLIEKSCVDDVVVVGGSSNIPKVQESLQMFFEGKKIWNTIVPNEAVVRGASYFARLIGG